MKKIVLFALAIFIAMGVMAQSDNVIIFNLDDSTHGNNYLAGDATGIFDDGGERNTYSGGRDYWVTITSTCTTIDTTADSLINKNFLCLTIDWIDIGCNDTLYIYDGPNSSSPVLAKINNCHQPSTIKFFVSPSNPTGEMTVRFRTTVRDTALQPYKGFHVILECKKPCESINAVIDSVFDRLDRVTGQVIGHGTLTWVPDYIDTVFYVEIDSSRVTRTDTIWDADSVNFTTRDTSFIAYDTTIFDRWHGEGTSNDVPRISGTGHANTNWVSTRYMEDADYFKIKTVTLGYDFKYLWKACPFQQLRLYVQAQNLHTFTKYTGLDPEVGNAAGADGWASGIDLGLYPPSRTFLVGASIKF